MLQKNPEAQISAVASLVEELHLHEGSGHDWQHIRRVWLTAENIGRKMGADILVVAAAALLHDADDRKLTGDIATEDALPTARCIMAKSGMETAVIERVCDTVRMIGFHKSLKGIQPDTLEAMVVSDADQLDAIGAVGIARTFVYGASRQRAMFDPDRLPMTEFTAAQYDKDEGHTVSHFFEKLLKLRERMFTEAGRIEADRRHRRMVDFLEGFFEETSAQEAWSELLSSYRIDKRDAV
jgi:uncharacterized protein|nr:HD domain-containing protein [Neorhizobium tomejilense]